MRAAVLTGIRQIELRDVPDPQIEKDTDVLLQIERVGICGSDVHYYETGAIGSQVVQYPFIVGHECAATVAKVGPAVDRVVVGQEVVVEPAVSCHACDQCRKGRENTCHRLRFLGTPGQSGGCLSDYIVMPQEACFPSDGAISLDQGALCEPLAIAVYAVKRSQLPEKADVAVLGAGPVGLSCMLSVRAAGVGACYVTEKIAERAAAARQNGATWVGDPLEEDVVAAILSRQSLGMDVVYECAGQQETIDQAIDLLKPGGRLMLIGIPRASSVSFSIDKARRKEITVVNVRRQNNCTQEAIDLVASGRVAPDFMVTHRFQLERVKDAFELVAAYGDGVVKAMIEM